MNNGSHANSQVIINVYNISPHNSWLSVVGLGVYHTGVEIYGKEYSFGGHSMPNKSGIYSVQPKQGPSFSYIKHKESIVVGNSQLEPTEIANLIKEMAKSWVGPSYHLLDKNCNHFSAEFCEKLVHQETAKRAIQQCKCLNRLANIGNAVPWIIPQTLLNTPDAFDETSVLAQNPVKPVKRTVSLKLPRLRRASSRASSVPTAYPISPQSLTSPTTNVEEAPQSQNSNGLPTPESPRSTPTSAKSSISSWLLSPISSLFTSSKKPQSPTNNVEKDVFTNLGEL